MTKKPSEYPRDDTRLVLLQHLLKIRTLGIKWKRAIDKTKNDSMAKVKCENRQRKSCIAQTNYKHFQEGYKRLHG